MTIFIVISLFSSCGPEVADESLYTFTDKMMGQYFQDPDSAATYSEFAHLLDTTGVIGLLNAYGTYTCFAPTNEAMYKFYLTRGKTSLADFTIDSLKIIAYDHIINKSAISYSKFVEGRLPDLTMSDRYISISFTLNGSVFVNKTSRVLKKDILVHNGVIHKINEVLNPTRAGIVEAISKDEDFTLFYNALIATGLADSLIMIKDDSYDMTMYKDLVTVPQDAGNWFYQEVPAARKYGFTVLMESNSTMAANGITNLESMKAYAAGVYDIMYPEDKDVTDITDRRNSLNRFIAYHLINKQLSYSKFIDAYDTDHMIKTRDMYEYIETMCPNTLIEIKKERLTGKTNLINYSRETGRVIQISSTNFDKDATNGVYHEIDGMLVYDQIQENELSTKRLRFDAASFFPELTNNNMRGLGNTLPNKQYRLPRGYISRITSSEQTVVSYLTPYYKYQDFQGDEIFLGAASGKLYDFTIVTPPVPAGTYEVRFGYLTNGKRGVAQLYIDDVPAGVPLNLNNKADDISIGYKSPGSEPDDPFGFENDKMMRNRGFMKGPANFKVPTTGWTYGENARYCEAALRRILGTYTFSKAQTHTMTVKGLSGGEFMFDYLEFVPTSALESEDIY